jgi:hypothetical protein
MTDRLDPNPGVADLEQVGAEDFAKLVAEASEDQLAAIVDGPSREQVLDEIFGRMAAHVEPERARATDASTSRSSTAPNRSVAATTTMRWCSRTASAPPRTGSSMIRR